MLRRIATRGDLPNELDWERVAEEIEDVGHAQRSAVQSHIRRLVLVHLRKAASVSNPELRTKWFGEVVGFHSEITDRDSRSMRQDIDMARLWRQAYKQAALNLESFGQEIMLPRDAPCPFELEDFPTKSSIRKASRGLRRCGRRPPKRCEKGRQNAAP